MNDNNARHQPDGGAAEIRRPSAPAPYDPRGAVPLVIVALVTPPALRPGAPRPGLRSRYPGERRALLVLAVVAVVALLVAVGTAAVKSGLLR